MTPSPREEALIREPALRKPRAADVRKRLRDGSLSADLLCEMAGNGQLDGLQVSAQQITYIHRCVSLKSDEPRLEVRVNI